MNYIVSYANGKFLNALDYLEKSLDNSPSIKLLKYTDKDLPINFVNQYSQHFKVKRGGGYWLWKPYVILDAIKKLNDGDILIYVDSGMSAITDVNLFLNYFAKIRSDIFLFKNHGLQNQVWTKRDCFVLMDCDSEMYYFDDQVNAAVQIYRKSNFSMTFLKEYFEYCSNIDIVGDGVSKLNEEFVSFKEHRHDQSVLTNLSIKYKINLYRNPTQFGNHLLEDKFITNQTKFSHGLSKFDEPFKQSSYPQIFDHHRRRFNFKDSFVKNIILKIYIFFK